MSKTVTVNGVTYTKWVSEGMGWQREDGGWMADEERPAMLDRIAELEDMHKRDRRGAVEITECNESLIADNTRLREERNRYHEHCNEFERLAEIEPTLGDALAEIVRLREALRECAENGITRAVREALQGDKDGR